MPIRRILALWLLSLCASLLAAQAASAVPANSNTDTITVPATGDGPGPSHPYPSNIDVQALDGVISKVTVKLTGVTHTFPDDIDALVVGPSGQKVLLMSDTGGGFDVNGVNLTFDDAAFDLLPDDFQITSGTYKPTNFDTNTDNFAAPAPAGPYADALSVFNGTDPNGTWKLYVMDDSPGDSGSISGGWALTFATMPAPAAQIPPPASGTGSGTPPGDKTAPVASVSIPKQRLSKIVKTGKLVEKVRTNEAGSITAQAVLARKLAKKLGLPANGKVFTSAKPAIVAKGSRSASKAGTYRVTLKLTKKARRKLKRLKQVRLELRTRVADKAGNRRLVKKSATFKH